MKEAEAVDESFINFNRTLSKIDVEAVSISYSNDIADLTTGIEKQKHLLEQVESLEVENDTEV